MTDGQRRPTQTRLYAAVNADLALSRRLTDRRSVQRRLLGLATHLNAEFAPDLAAHFMITLGDEIQGLLSDPTRFPAIVSRIHAEFRPQAITIGGGIGEVATRLSPRVTEMDGSAFVNARTAVERAKKKRLEVVVVSGEPDLDENVNTIYALMTGIQARWTLKQWERVNLYRKFQSIELVARKAGVTKQAVSADLKHTLWDRILEAEALLPGILARSARHAQKTRPRGGG